MDTSTSRRLVNLGAIVGTIVLLTSAGATLDQWDHLADQQRALDDAVAQHQADQRRDLAALKICGPHAEPRWASATELHCANNGNRVRKHIVAQAGGVQP